MRAQSALYLGIMALLATMSCGDDPVKPPPVTDPCANLGSITPYTGELGMVVHGCPYRYSVVRFSTTEMVTSGEDVFLQLNGILGLNTCSMTLTFPQDTGRFIWRRDSTAGSRAALSIDGGALDPVFTADSGVTVIKTVRTEGTIAQRLVITGRFSGRVRDQDSGFLMVDGAFSVSRP